MSAFIAILPEIILLGMSCLILLLDLIFKSQRKNMMYYLTQLTLIMMLMTNLYLYQSPVMLIFNQSYIFDPLGSLMKILIEMTSIIVFWFSHEYIKSHKIPVAEFYLLGLFAILGMMILVSAHNIIILFLALELSALPVYALVALWQESPYGQEAAIKYFVMGSLASGILLYGLSLLYGATGSLNLAVINQTPHDLLLIFAMVFILAGIAFKFGAAPFHLWVPDIYTGAPTAITLFISAAPKIAILGIAFRLLTFTLPALAQQFQQILIILAITSMGLGNFAAIMQTNLKRMLAYSSIAHIGYLFLGLISGTNEGYAAALFYMLSYSLMVIGAFGLLVMLSNKIEIEDIKQIKGLNSRNPWLAFMFLLILFSMAGIPPSAGFFAKLGVLQALIHVHLIWLAVLSLIFSIIGAYYYINVVRTMYFELPDENEKQPFSYSLSLHTAVTITSIGVLLLGVFPGLLISLTQMVF